MACAVCVLSKLARVQSEKNCCCCFRFSIIWKVEATSNSPHFLFIWTFPSSCSFWHCVPAWLTLKLRININISCFVSHPDHPGQISCGENDSLNYYRLLQFDKMSGTELLASNHEILRGSGEKCDCMRNRRKCFGQKFFGNETHRHSFLRNMLSWGGE